MDGGVPNVAGGVHGPAMVGGVPMVAGGVHAWLYRLLHSWGHVAR